MIQKEILTIGMIVAAFAFVAIISVNPVEATNGEVDNQAASQTNDCGNGVPIDVFCQDLASQIGKGNSGIIIVPMQGEQGGGP